MFFFSSRRRHTRCALVTGVQTFALPISNPQHLAPFDASSPFYGLATPSDVTVTQQVLAEPTIDLGSHTWARLEDGTPLVTAAKRDKGFEIGRASCRERVCQYV